jgi:hypothetical protein
MTRRLVVSSVLTLVFVVSFLAGCATGGGQPHMRDAMDELRAARRSLAEASSDKGGHRTRAMQLIDDAMAEVQAGIDYAAR